MRIHYFDEMTMGELIIRQLEMRYATIERAKELVPVSAVTDVARSQFEVQLQVLLAAILDAKSLMESVQVEDCEEN